MQDTMRYSEAMLCDITFLVFPLIQKWKPATRIGTIVTVPLALITVHVSPERETIRVSVLKPGLAKVVRQVSVVDIV